ncbi:hypothetical protein [Frisingicoccus sp.]|uniref:hypothetical protein n=1 Tax=Frisingicoccus sp. TaxID=1918627 RepID=UPI003AB7B49A
MGRSQKKQGTFIVKIMSTQNSTWQGNVTWVEQNKVQNFRSALELMKMLDAAISENNGESFV